MQGMQVNITASAGASSDTESFLSNQQRSDGYGNAGAYTPRKAAATEMLKATEMVKATTEMVKATTELVKASEEKLVTSPTTVPRMPPGFGAPPGFGGGGALTPMARPPHAMSAEAAVDFILASLPKQPSVVPPRGMVHAAFAAPMPAAASPAPAGAAIPAIPPPPGTLVRGMTPHGTAGFGSTSGAPVIAPQLQHAYNAFHTALQQRGLVGSFTIQAAAAQQQQLSLPQQQQGGTPQLLIEEVSGAAGVVEEESREERVLTQPPSLL